MQQAEHCATCDKPTGLIAGRKGLGLYAAWHKRRNGAPSLLQEAPETMPIDNGSILRNSILRSIQQWQHSEEDCDAIFTSVAFSQDSTTFTSTHPSSSSCVHTQSHLSVACDEFQDGFPTDLGKSGASDILCLAPSKRQQEADQQQDAEHMHSYGSTVNSLFASRCCWKMFDASRMARASTKPGVRHGLATVAGMGH
jgi:hypothetical protein